MSIYTILSNSTLYLNSLLQLSTSALYFNSLLQLSTSTLYFNSLFQLSISTLYFNSLLQLSTSTLYSIHKLSSLLNPCFFGQFPPSLSLINQSFAFLNHYRTFVFVDPPLSAIYYLYHFPLIHGYTLVLWSLPLWSHDIGDN